MGWFSDKFKAEPIECPRGWGEVSFTSNVVVLPVMLVVETVCPIGGVDHCGKCRHPVEPGTADDLRVKLEELESLRGSVLTDEEFRIRRRLIVRSREPYDGVPGEKPAMAAMVLGPLGVVATGVGWFLAATVHAGFLGLLGGGLVLTSLALGLAGISRMQRRALKMAEDPLLDALPEGTLALESRLHLAEEELGFFRELHRPETPGGSQPPAEEKSE
jgi:hypothetical protein